MWEINKSFNFAYGHRVWTQELNTEFSIDNECKCRHLHGHEALVKVFLHGTLNKQGMVTDFKHLNWLKQFLDTYLDHKFIIDISDPNFERITNCELEYVENKIDSPYIVMNCNYMSKVKECVMNKMVVGKYIELHPYQKVTGEVQQKDIDLNYKLDKEFYESFFIVNFVPTSENLARWLYHIVRYKMSELNVDTSKIEWNETPKSQAIYRG